MESPKQPEELKILDFIQLMEKISWNIQNNQTESPASGFTPNSEKFLDLYSQFYDLLDYKEKAEAEYLKQYIEKIKSNNK